MGLPMVADNARAGTRTESDFGLSENVESPCSFHARALSASVNGSWTQIVLGLCAFVARTVSRMLHGCCATCCVSVALHIAWMFHSCCADCCVNCFAICFADFTGNCLDIYQPLRQPLRGHSSLLREMFPGNYSDTAWQLPAASPDTTRDAARLANRLLRVRDTDCFLICQGSRIFRCGTS